MCMASPARLANLLVPALLSVLLVVMGLGCAGGQEEEQGLVVGEFVGEVPDTDAFFALLAEEPEGGALGGRNVSAYLSDGKQLSEWFRGFIRGNGVSLTSQENKLELSAYLYPEAATATIVLPSSGEAFGFEVPLAEGVSGFYRVIVPSVGGSFSSTSFSGVVLEGTRSAEGEIRGTITPPDNRQAAQEFELSEPNVEGSEDRWILISEEGRLRIKGAERQASSSGIVEPNYEDLKRPGFIELNSVLSR